MSKHKPETNSKPRKSRVFVRAEHEWYVEPPKAVHALLNQERFVGGVYDPACGSGNIVRTCLERGTHAVGTDIVARKGMPEENFKGIQDFLAATEIHAPNIVTNPPYYRAKGTQAFIRKALSFPGLCKLAVFSEIGFLAAENRILMPDSLFAELPPSRIWIISPRVSAPPGTYLEEGGKDEGGTKDAIWMIWDRSFEHSGPPVIGWAVHTKGFKNPMPAVPLKTIPLL